jgi:phospholipase/carboxylesterase
LSQENSGPDFSDTSLIEAAGLTYRVRRPEAINQPTVPTIVMIHGYGANDGDVYELVPYYDRRLLIAAPRGPGLYSADPRGSFKWYDMDLQTCQAEPGAPDQNLPLLLQSLEALPSSVNLEIDPSQFYIGGFSQGAVMSLVAVSARPELFTGVICHSCPYSEELAQRLRGAADKLRGKPFFLAHGMNDFLPIAEHGRKLAEVLREIGADLTYKEYEFGHETSEQSRRDMAAWLNPRLK